MNYYVIKQIEKLKNNVDLSNYNMEKHKVVEHICINGDTSIYKLPTDYTVKKTMFEKVHFISSDIKEVFEMFKDDIEYRPLVISDVEANEQILMWEINFNTILNLKNKLDRVISVPKNEINNELIFAIYNNINNMIVIREDVLECILKRNFYGMEFHKVTLLNN